MSKLFLFHKLSNKIFDAKRLVDEKFLSRFFVVSKWEYDFSYRSIVSMVQQFFRHLIENKLFNTSQQLLLSRKNIFGRPRSQKCFPKKLDGFFSFPLSLLIVLHFEFCKERQVINKERSVGQFDKWFFIHNAVVTLKQGWWPLLGYRYSACSLIWSR